MNLARTKRAMRFVPALCASLAMAACTVTRPTVVPVGGAVAAEGGGAMQIAIELQLSNPGEDEIELVEYEYLLKGSDGSSYNGRWAALLALPPETTTRATIPAVVPAGAEGRSWTLQGTLTYRDPKSLARLLYELGFVQPKSGFQADGLTIRAHESH